MSSANKVLLVFFVSFFQMTAISSSFASSLHIGAVQDQTINLGAKLSVSVSITADQAQTVDLAFLPTDISDEVSARDISVQIDQAHLTLAQGQTQVIHLSVQTLTSAPSFQGRKFVIEAKSSSDGIMDTEIVLNVAPIYIIQVLDGPDTGAGAATSFDFDSQTDTAYFRPHTEGLQIIFENKSSKPEVIHGTGLIKHQDEESPSNPGESYLPPMIYPTDGFDAVSGYTIHDVYHPVRNVVLNATTIPVLIK